jgi:hypothetical protein
MNSAVLAILGAIAAVLATIGFVLFGKPSGGTTTGSVQSTERVLADLPVETETPPIGETPVPEAQPMEKVDAAPVEVAIVEPTIEANVEANVEPTAEPIVETPEFIPEATVSEVAGSEETTTGGLTLDSVTQPETIDLNEAYIYAEEQPIVLNLDDSTQANAMANPTIESSTVAEPDLHPFAEPLTLRRAQPVPPMAIASSLSTNNPPIQHAPYCALNDPKRPVSLASQKLSQQILTWGQSSKNATQVITYSQDPDPMIRKYVAQSLTIMATQTSDRTTIPTVISTLEKLSQDTDSGVKSIAQSALG